MAQGTTDQASRGADRERTFTWFRTRLRHADPGAVAGAVLEAIAAGALESVHAGDIRSVEVSLIDRTLVITGDEKAVEEVREFIRKADETAKKAQETQEALGATRSNWVEDPGHPAAPPLNDLDALRADFWPEDETADDFIAAVRDWRRSRRSRTLE